MPAKNGTNPLIMAQGITCFNRFKYFLCQRWDNSLIQKVDPDVIIVSIGVVWEIQFLRCMQQIRGKRYDTRSSVFHD
jgi:hypothetical protein